MTKSTKLDAANAARRPSARDWARRKSGIGLAALAAALCADGAKAQQSLPAISIGAATIHRRAAAPRPAVAAAPRVAPAPTVSAPAPGPTVAAPASFIPQGVQLGRGPTGVVGYVAAGTSTATKTNTKILDIPQSVTILTKQQLQDRGSQSVQQALTYVPGVTVAQGEGNRDQIVIRGQNSTADFFTDGVRDDAEYYRDLYNIQAVEVLKGPSALIFGRGGGGGVVNRVTKKADGETIRELQVSTGSFGRKRVTADVGQAVSDTLALRLNALYEHSYGFRDYFKLERYGVNPTLTWKPGDKTFITLSYEHFRDRRTADRGIPAFGGINLFGAHIVPGYPLGVPKEAFFGDGNPSVEQVNYSKVDLNSARMMIDHTTEFGLNIRNQTVYADYQKRYQNTFPDQTLGLITQRFNGGLTAVTAPAITSPALARLDGYVSANPRQNVFNQTDFTYKFEMTPDIRHTLLFGAEFGNQKSDNNRDLSCFNFSCATRRVTTPFTYPTVYNFVAFANPERRQHTDLDLAAGYVQDQIEVTKYVDILAGVRFDSFDLKFAGWGNGRPLENMALRRVDTVWSPRLGLVVKPTERLSFYGSYSQSFLPMSGDQFALLTPSISNLAPQGFENFEIGFKAELLPHLLLTGALYNLNRTNQPLTVGVASAVLADTRTRGSEIALVGYLTDEWQASLGYGLQDARVVKSDRFTPAFQDWALTGFAGAAPDVLRMPLYTDVGKILPSVPRDTFSFWNKYDFSSHVGADPGVLGAGLGVVYNSKFMPALDLNGTVIIPGYARVDGAVFVKLTENISGQLNVENVLGARYFASAHNNNNIMPGAPRSAYVTVTARF